MISFLLSVFGLAGVSIIPLWQTALLLLLLIFLAAYFMHSRIGLLFIQEKPVFEEIGEELDQHESNYSLKNQNSIELASIDEESQLPNLVKESTRDLTSISKHIGEVPNIQDEPLLEKLSFVLEKNTDIEINELTEEPNLEAGYIVENESLMEISPVESADRAANVFIENDELPTFEIQERTNVPGEEQEPLNGALYDFLLAEKEVAADREELIEATLENSYLSEIESLLELDSEALLKEKADGLLEEIENLPVIESIEESSHTKYEKEILEDSLFDFLLAEKETAGNHGEILAEIKKEEVSLQK
ncbi:hypothetical protein [Neobacillus kokaensis]|nr:hypothetical protein [Neobacillus kokaensis]